LTKAEKEVDFSKLFGLLGEEKLKDLGNQLVAQAINGEKIEYEEYQVKITVPSTVMRLLESLTEIFPVDLETVLSKMASQGLNNILQGVTPTAEETNDNLLDNIEPINKISDQLSDLQSVIGRFSDMQKIFGDLTNGANLTNTVQDKKDS
jgi:hypothetical protein